jgi:hypothetical protein
MFYDDIFGDLEQKFKSISIAPCMSFCHNFSLGLATKARACKVASQERKLGSERKCEGINLTFLRELSPWKLESRWTPECSESDCKGENPMD